MKVSFYLKARACYLVKSQEHARRVKDIACSINTSHNKHESIMNSAKNANGST